MTQAGRFGEVFLTLLVASAGVVSAQPTHVGDAGLASLTAPSEVCALPVPSYAQNQALSWGLGDGDGDDHDHDKDHDKNHNKNHHGPNPTPEPSTIWSFSAALLIGSGVFYSRRLRKNK